MKLLPFLGAIFYVSVSFFSNSQQVLTPELLWKLNRISGAKVSPDGTKVLYEIRSFSIEKNTGNTDLYVYDLAKNKSLQITNTPFSEMDAQWGGDNSIWFLSEESKSVQIWKMNEKGENKVQVSNIQELEIEGFKLSPDSKNLILIAPIKMKANLKDKHPDLPLANARLEDDLLYRHWNHWQDDAKRHLFLFKLADDKLSISYKDLLENESYDGILPPFGGSDQLIFSPDNKKIIYNCKKKRGKSFALSTNSQLYEYVIETGKTSNLTNSYHGYDSNAKYASNGQYLAWLSMKTDGFEADKNDIILRDLNSGEDVNITKNQDLTVDEFCFSPDFHHIYFIAPYLGVKQLFEINLTNLQLNQLTKDKADLLSLELAKNELILTRQSMIEPTEVFSFNLKSKKIKALTNVNEKMLAGISKPSVQERWIETSDGKKMLVWMVFPPHFDGNKKYPSVLYCQGGPQSMVSQFFSYRWNLSLLASQGYIVIAPNRRGLPGFGQQWNDEISKDWGGQAMKDYLSAVDDISNEPYIDVNRIGAVGASYGGYSVYYLAGIHNGRFKTFISHCGLFNLESWYGTTEELFFANWDNKGPYWLPENKEYYEKNSPHNFVQNWKTPMLVIHGGMDFRVPESEGMQAYQALQIKGIRSKYLYFPKEGHWISSPQNGILWYREFIEWLDTDLKK